MKEQNLEDEISSNYRKIRAKTVSITVLEKGKDALQKVCQYETNQPNGWQYLCICNRSGILLQIPIFHVAFPFSFLRNTNSQKEEYVEPCQTSKTAPFPKSLNGFQRNYFHKTLHLGCSSGF